MMKGGESFEDDHFIENKKSRSSKGDTHKTNERKIPPENEPNIHQQSSSSFDPKETQKSKLYFYF